MRGYAAHIQSPLSLRGAPAVTRTGLRSRTHHKNSPRSKTQYSKQPPLENVSHKCTENQTHAENGRVHRYRKHLILREILGYRPDIITLQESEPTPPNVVSLIAEKERMKSFVFEHTPLLRVAILEGLESVYVIVTQHHCILDGW